MQARFTRAHGRFRLGPNLGLDATAAHRPRDFAALKEKHFRTTLLRSRATRMRHGGHDNTLATVAGLINQAIQITLWNGRHGTLCFFVRVFCWRVYVTHGPGTKGLTLCLLCATSVFSVSLW